MKQVLWLIFLAAIGVVTAAFQLDRQSRYDGQLAHSVPQAARYFAQAQLAADAINAGEEEAALAATRRLLERRPIPAENMRLHAQALLDAGDADQGLLAMQLAAQRGWRDPMTQQVMAQIAWAAGDAAAAANRLGALYALGSDDPVLQGLSQEVLSDPDGREQMAILLASPARWEARFVQRARHHLSRDSFNAILLQAHEQGAVFTCGPVRQAAERQAREQRIPIEQTPLASLIESDC